MSERGCVLRRAQDPVLAAMNVSAKYILVAVGSLAGLVVLIVAAAAVYVGFNPKARVEAAASEAMGMDVTVVGRATVGMFPRLHFALEDVRIRDRDADVASAGEVDLAIAVLPLLRHELRIEKIGLKRLQVAIARDRNGNLRVGGPTPTPREIPGQTITNVSASEVTLLYTDERTGKRLNASGCEFHSDRLELPPSGRPGFLVIAPFTATLACGQLRTNDFTASDLKLTIEGKGETVDIDLVTMRLLGGLGSGKVHADYAGSAPVYHVLGDLRQFRMEEFFEALSPKKVGAGLLDFSANVTLSGPMSDALVPTMDGKLSVHGANLKLDIGDVDKRFSRYETSQNFNLVDVGAVFFVGPLGLVVTKGYNFANIFQGTGGTTTVRKLVSEWKIEHGVAHAKDVAMATPQNRVALKGRLNFVTGQFEDVTLALVDAHGCAQVEQRVRGPLLHPQVEPPSVLKGLTGPTRRLLAKLEGMFGAKCDVFYAGSVAPPTQP